LYGTAWRILRSPQEAEEVVQEAFLTLYRKARQSDLRNLGAWLHRVTANRSIDQLRSRTHRSEVELNEDLQAESTPPLDGAAAVAVGAAVASEGASYGLGLDIERAIDRLPERTRMVFLLHDVEGFKHREIGEMMGIRDGSSKSQLFRARAMLRDWLRPGTER